MTNDFSYRAYILLPFLQIICQVTYCRCTGQYKGIRVVGWIFWYEKIILKK